MLGALAKGQPLEAALFTFGAADCRRRSNIDQVHRLNFDQGR